MVDRVGAVVALKPLAKAKSRVTDIPAPLRQRLAWLMAVDTLSALSLAVDHVLVISDQPSLHASLQAIGLGNVEVLPEQSGNDGELPGLNSALRQGDLVLRERRFDSVLACVSDLPTATAAAIRRLTSAVSARRLPSTRAFLSDAGGIGTTMLIASGVPLNPLFEGASAAAHLASGAYLVTDADLGGPAPELRSDVDDLQALLVASRLGVGHATRRLIDPVYGGLASYLNRTPQSTPERRR